MVPITGELSSLLSWFSLEMQAETALYLIERIHQYTETLTDRPVGNPQRQSRHDRSELSIKLENARGWHHGLVAQCEYLVPRTSAQIQAVYALLASQNSIVKIDIARASNVMAELSRSDNQAMLHLSELGRRDARLVIDIARESRSVALSTARDSACMRVIL
ncbi:hypothetical protein BJX61DRAFT_546148 [Aspergillus egyptiacus]|nr:hypothetical protein BJX61DRAFT_546148 [Aspergillus egyptiacus]